MIDKEDSVFTAKDHTDQWLIRERSVCLVALHIDYRHHTDMTSGDWYQVAWDSRLEVDFDAEEKTSQTQEDQSVEEQSTTV